VYFNSFKVCTDQTAEPQDTDYQLQWDWVVFGSDVVDAVA
jgi:hypothetical protein